MACRQGSPALLEPSGKRSSVNARVMSTTSTAGRRPKPARTPMLPLAYRARSASGMMLGM
jgi:hypothetical protein